MSERGAWKRIRLRLGCVNERHCKYHGDPYDLTTGIQMPEGMILCIGKGRDDGRCRVADEQDNGFAKCQAACRKRAR